MAYHKKPKRGPGSNQPEVKKHAEIKEHKEKIVKDITKQALKEFKIGFIKISRGALKSDLTSVRHGRVIDKVEAKLKEFEAENLKKIDELLDRKMPYAEFIRELDRLKKLQKRKAYGWKNSLLDALRKFGGKNGQLERKDYAYIYSLVDGVNKICGMDTEALFAHIKSNNLNKKEWDKVCDLIHQNPNKSRLTNAGDEIKLSVTAMLFKIMDPYQKYQAVKEYSKRYPKAKAINLAESLTKTGALNIRQYEALMRDFKGPQYKLTQAKEKEIKTAQKVTQRIIRGVDRKLGGAMFVQGRMINRYQIAKGIFTGIGALTVVTAYMSNFNSKEGLAKLLPPTSPYFFAGAAAVAGGSHMVQKGMYAGKHGQGWLNGIIPKPKRLSNPFGLGTPAKVKERHFEKMTEIFQDNRLIEEYFVNQKGFDDLSGFYTKRRFEAAKKVTSVKEKKPKITGRSKSLFDDYVKYVEKKHGKNSPQAIMLRETGRRYGKATMSKHLVEIAAVQQEVGIPTSKAFKKSKVRGQLFTFNNLYDDLSGKKPIQRSKRPAIRAAAKAKAAKAAKAKKKKTT